MVQLCQICAAVATALAAVKHSSSSCGTLGSSGSTGHKRKDRKLVQGRQYYSTMLLGQPPPYFGTCQLNKGGGCRCLLPFFDFDLVLLLAGA
jgi:hypothetical protein